MTSQNFVLILFTSLLMASGNLALKWGIAQAEFQLSTIDEAIQTISRLLCQPAFWCGFFFYSIATVLWLLILSKQSISLSYPVFVTCAFVFVTVGASIFFQEALTLHRLIGIVLMIAGIAYVSLR